jgi:hypothetical protein
MIGAHHDAVQKSQSPHQKDGLQGASRISAIGRHERVCPMIFSSFSVGMMREIVISKRSCCGFLGFLGFDKHEIHDNDDGDPEEDLLVPKKDVSILKEA